MCNLDPRIESVARQIELLKLEPASDARKRFMQSLRAMQAWLRKQQRK